MVQQYRVYEVLEEKFAFKPTLNQVTWHGDQLTLILDHNVWINLALNENDRHMDPRT